MIIDKQAKSRAHMNTRDIILNSLITRGIEYDIFRREQTSANFTSDKFVDSTNYDLVISLGGDGTFLYACHLIPNSNTPVFGVNSDNDLSEGFLVETDHSTLETRIELLLTSHLPLVQYPRLVAWRNDKQFQVKALNEIYMGRLQGYKMARYELKLGDGTKERQKSSGLLISTGLGSTAWYKSAGGTPFSKHADYSEFIVRECYEGRLTSCKHVQGRFNANGRIMLRMLVDEMVIAMDSIKEYPLSGGDTLVVEFEKNSISVVDFGHLRDEHSSR
ncbi:MAG: NAD(+)/NADH kinase [Candidatus Odinarchaeota archaeon]